MMSARFLIGFFSFISLFASDDELITLTRTGQRGLVNTFSAQTIGKGRVGFHLYTDYSNDPRYLLGMTKEDTSRSINIQNSDIRIIVFDTVFDTLLTEEPTLFNINAGLTYGITDFFEFSANVPFYGDFGDRQQMLFATGFGDLELSFKFQYPPYPHPGFFEMAYKGILNIPTGTQGKGLFPRHNYYISEAIKEKPDKEFYDLQLDSLVGTTKKAEIQAHDYDYVNTAKDPTTFYTSREFSAGGLMLWTFDFSKLRNRIPLRWHVNYGVLFTGSINMENVLIGASGIEIFPVPFVKIFSDFWGETEFSKKLDLAKSPLKITTGLSLTSPLGLSLTFFFEKGLSYEYGSWTKDNPLTWIKQDKKDFYRQYATQIIPEFGMGMKLNSVVSLIPQDPDKDGIAGKRDACPNIPEDMDEFEDGDGCPEEDNDRDQVVDAKDKCPLEAEDSDGFEDQDGCPEGDNDRDGLSDLVDRCPSEMEDRDDFQDDDGCPEKDNDLDGIEDRADQCPNVAEDKDGFEDQDGCPDTDNDKDGIADNLDKCPQDAETVNGIRDDDGCPDKEVKEIKKGRLVLKGVNFKTGSAELTFESYDVLDKVFESLQAFQDVKVEIRGHTDNVGNDASNLTLSQRRAETVYNYLLRKGIGPERLRPVGYGEKDPIGSNRTADGRAKNRRIEFFRAN